MGSHDSPGPLLSAGTLLGTLGAPDANILAGASLFFQGSGFPDPRYLARGGRIGGNWGFKIADDVRVVDQVPAGSAATPVNIAPAANVVSGTAMTLAATSGSAHAAIPFYPQGASTPVVSGLTLDFGFGLVATTANSGTVTPIASLMPLFQPGMSLVIADVGNSGGTIPLLTRVQTVGASTITVSPAPQATNGSTHVGQGNILSPMSTTAPSAADPRMLNGFVGFWDPAQLVSRGVGIAGSASATGGVFTVAGYDVYGVAMTEAITHSGGTAVVYGKKAFKHIMSVTPGFTDAHNYSVGTSDVIGFTLRNSFFEHNEVYVAGAFITANTGWTAADTTSPATSTTGDVRGTIQIGTRGPLGSGIAGGPLSGSIRVVMKVSVPLAYMTQGTQASAVSLFGVPQA